MLVFFLSSPASIVTLPDNYVLGNLAFVTQACEASHLAYISLLQLAGLARRLPLLM